MKLDGSQQVQEMNELLVRLLFCQLKSIGLFAKQRATAEERRVTAGVRVRHAKWLAESLSVLASRSLVRFEGELCLVTDAHPQVTEAAWQEWDTRKAEWLQDENAQAQVRLVEMMLRALPQILTGQRLATDVMFPSGAMDMVEGVYKNNAVSDYFNEVLADLLVAYLQERVKRDPSAKLRVLEIGAGTGGTSAMIFRKLKPFQQHIAEYGYTDLSEAFLRHAQKEYGPANPYLTYHVFDVEAQLAGQKIRPGSYDVVIAANVLHATKKIRQTLRNAKGLLKKNGLLLLNEISTNSLFAHLVFGLLDGWWLYEDPQLRIPGCPGLYPDTWKSLLESEGFRSVYFPAAASHEFGQQIVVAESDGIVRQTHRIAAPNPLPEPEHRLVPTLPSARPSRPQAEVSMQSVSDFVKETLICKLSESLKIDRQLIDVEQSFADYGLDSITGVNLISLINDSLGIELETISLFDYSSVMQLTRHIASTNQDVIARRLHKQGPELKAAPPETFQVRESRPVASGRPVESKREGWPTANHPSQTEKAANTVQQGPIAIIGISGRFAGAQNVDELWNQLANGADMVGEITRWPMSDYVQEDGSQANRFCNYGSFLDDIDQFDPLFFNISGLEATYMDPQQRFFLEESWKALEDAGYAGNSTQGSRCGVYVGYNGGDYQRLFEEHAPAQAMWGNAASVVPARIAYYLDLHGPAITVDTACSSSLVAIHLACQGLWMGETEMALAGGVFLQTTPGFYVSANRAGMLSPTGRCRTFDQAADGFVPGEGVGVIVLKRLSDALADGDHIYGVIRGSGINQDGTTNGITAPSAQSQERLERHIYDRFSINPEQIQLLEAHGTGTILGDPIEYQALTRAFRAYTDKTAYCAIGSIKSNIGHTASAAGVAGVLKVLASLQHKQIPPHLHFQAGNPNIPFDGSPFYVNTSLKVWDVEPGVKRTAAVSAFGFSGTNAHMVIEEAPHVQRHHEDRPGYLIVLSARTAHQLRKQAEQLAAYCTRHEAVDCGNISFTLLLGRRHFHHRLACVVRDANELAELLQRWLETGKAARLQVSALPEQDRREQAALKRFGNQCIENCRSIHNEHEYEEQLATIAELYIQGYELDYDLLFAGDQYSRISLPTYPFVKERYWVPARAEHAPRQTGQLLIASAQPQQAAMQEAETAADTAEVTGTSIEATLLQMVSDILRIPQDQVEVDSDLAGYGFDSISGLSLINGIKAQYGLELSPRVVFESQSIRQLTQHLLAESQVQGICMQHREEDAQVQEAPAQYPLSVGQMGLWFLHQLAPDGYAYHLPNAFRLQRKVDVEALKAAFHHVVQRHPQLRTRFGVHEQEVVHLPGADGTFLFEWENVSTYSEKGLRSYLTSKARQPFDLETGPLLRVHLLTRAEDDHILLINVHHMVFDGSSLLVLLRELLHFYAGELSEHREPLPVPRRSYADFVTWQSKWLQSEEAHQHQAYWQHKLEGDLPVLDLPTDRPRTAAQTKKGKTFVRELTPDMAERIQQLSRAEKVSPFVLMLSILKTQLRSYASQDEMVIGAPMQGRPGSEFENVIGYFSNLVAIRSQMPGTYSFRQLVQEVQRNTIEALEHGLYPFSEVVRGKRDAAQRGDFVQVVFVFQNWFKQSAQLVGANAAQGHVLPLEPMHEIHQEAEFELSLEVITFDQSYSLLFRYDPQRFEEGTIIRLADQYLALLQSVFENADQPLAQLSPKASERSAPNRQVAAKSDLQRIITSIYQEMLGVDDIQPTDNFFDLGGHSVLLVKIALRLKEALQRDVTTVELFQYPTVESLTRHFSDEARKPSFEKSKGKGRRQREMLMKLNANA